MRPSGKFPSKTFCIENMSHGRLQVLLDPFDCEDTRGIPLLQLRKLLEINTLQSILRPRSMPAGPLGLFGRRGRLSEDVFGWLLFLTSWQLLAETLESSLRVLQQEAATMAGGQAFAEFTVLRRQLAGAYGMLAEAQDLMKYGYQSGDVSWDVDGNLLSAEEFWSRERGQRVATYVYDQEKSSDFRDLPTLLEELLGRIKTMTQTVNEEIQMIIGSVQVEDARVMRRQTEWTVVLAVLAAIYLPMTLVTGIFGMNITEIGAEATAPNQWSVVKAWGIVFGATMGSVLVYAVARYVLRYRRVGRMLLRRKMRNIGDGWLYRKAFAVKARLQRLWLYRKIHGFREKMREWDVEAQKMEKME